MVVVLRASALVTHMYPRKPQMVIRHVLPVLWQLVGNLSGSGAMPGSSTNLRQVRTVEIINGVMTPLISGLANQRSDKISLAKGFIDNHFISDSSQERTE